MVSKRKQTPSDESDEPSVNKGPDAFQPTSAKCKTRCSTGGGLYHVF